VGGQGATGKAKAIKGSRIAISVRGRRTWAKQVISNESDRADDRFFLASSSASLELARAPVAPKSTPTTPSRLPPRAAAVVAPSPAGPVPMPRQPERELRLHDPHAPPHAFASGPPPPPLAAIGQPPVGLAGGPPLPPGPPGAGPLVNGTGPPPPLPPGPGAPNGLAAHGPSPVVGPAGVQPPRDQNPVIAKLAQANETTWLLLGMCVPWRHRWRLPHLRSS
jgi:hypothetical protein